MTAFLLLATALVAEEVWQSKGSTHFYSLEYDEAVAEFEKEIAANAADAGARNRLAQALLYRELYRAGALESELVSGANPFLRREKMEPKPADLAKLDGAIAQAMTVAQNAISKNPQDARAYYALAVAHGLRGNAGFLIRKTYMDALRDATQSRKYAQRALELEPGYVDPKIIQALHEYIVASLPFYMRMVGFLAGFHGDKEGGIRTLQMLAEKGHGVKIDAAIMLGIIYRRERKPLEAIPILLDLVQKFPRNFLFRLEQVQMYSDAGDKGKAVAVLDEVDRLKKAGTPGYERISYEKLAYVRGNVLFWYREFDAAIAQLKTATAKANELDLHSAVMSWLRLGQAYDSKGQRAEAVAAYKMAVQTAPQSEAAKEAKRYQGSRYIRVD